MPLSDLKLAASVQWTLVGSASAPFAAPSQGPNTVSFKLSGLDLDTWDQGYGVQVTLAGGANRDIDLTVLLNQINEAVTFTGLLALVVKCDLANAATPNGTLVVTPSAAFGFDAITDRVTVQPGGISFVSGSGSVAGYAVDSTHKNLNVANTGTDSIVATVVVVGTTL